jgi:hypothetical protein
VTRALLAALTAAAALAVAPAPASACDPERFPYCTTPCRALLWRYDELRASTSVELPAVPPVGLAGCP